MHAKWHGVRRANLGTGMPKPQITLVITGAALVAAVTLGIASAWQTRSGDDGTAAYEAPRDIARRHDELRFLKAAFDRLEAEAKQNPNSPALRSLRTEQEAVMLRMREVARPLPPERLPEELRALLGNAPVEKTAAAIEKPAKDEPRPVPRPAIAATVSQATTGAARPGELKPGLASASSAPALVLSRDPALSGVVLIARPRPPRPAAEAPAERPPANADANATADTKPPPRAQITVRAPERAPPATVSNSVERPPSGPVAILGR